jgi:hypothetical protein
VNADLLARLNDEYPASFYNTAWVLDESGDRRVCHAGTEARQRPRSGKADALDADHGGRPSGDYRMSPRAHSRKGPSCERSRDLRKLALLSSNETL